MAFGPLHHHHEQDQQEDIAEINMIPLVDVMLVLLIVFMVAAPLSLSGIKIDLPTSRAKAEIADEPKVVLTIDSKGKFFLDKTRIPEAELMSRIKSIFEFKEKKEIYIRADRNVRYEKVIDAMGAAKIAGVQKIAMLTRPPQEGSQN